MNDLLKNLMDTFLRAFAQETGKLTAGALFNFVSNRINRTSQAPSRTTHLGRIYYMNDNTLLLYSAQDSVVYGKSIAAYGNRWIATTISEYEDPANYNGGYANSHNISVDSNGRYYYD